MPFHESVAIAVAIVACTFDLQSRRIPNVLTFGAALAAVLIFLFTGGVWAAGWSIAGWTVAAALWLPLYARRGMGAGDVKLIAALGAWLGPGDAVRLSLFAAIAGAAFAVAVAIARRCLTRTWSNVRLLLAHWRVNGLTPLSGLTLATSDSPRLAYAVPILVGTMAAIWLG
jgi:prepilin peptidase CpaA